MGWLVVAALLLAVVATGATVLWALFGAAIKARLRHPRFVGLRSDKDPAEVVRARLPEIRRLFARACRPSSAELHELAEPQRPYDPQ